MTRTK